MRRGGAQRHGGEGYWYVAGDPMHLRWRSGYHRRDCSNTEVAASAISTIQRSRRFPERRSSDNAVFAVGQGFKAKIEGWARSAS
jgi:hypothetical protein